MKALLQIRATLQNTQEWQDQLIAAHFSIRAIYRFFRGCTPKIEWRDLVTRNPARPKARFILWLALHRRLATKDSLAFFGITTDGICPFCDEMETADHLFFQCPITYEIMAGSLSWLQIQHPPISNWQQLLLRLRLQARGKGSKAYIFRALLAETIYHIWMARNATIFQQRPCDIPGTIQEIAQIVSLRCRNAKVADLLRHL